MLRKACWLLVGIFYVAFVSVQASAQETFWQEHMAAATKAYKQGRYTEAEKSWQSAVKKAEEGFGPEDQRVFLSLRELVALYHVQGRITEAVPLAKRSLVIVEKIMGPEHPLVATSLNNLAALYQAQGKYAEAEPLYKRSLAIREKALGPEHPSVATSLSIRHL